MHERSDFNVTGYGLPKERYEWALDYLNNEGCLRVADAACGFGCGTKLLAEGEENHFVVGFDASRDALKHAVERYVVDDSGPCFILADVALQTFVGFEALVCLETVEHLIDPFTFVKNLQVPLLIISTTTKEPKGNDEWHKHEASEVWLRELVMPMFDITAEFKQRDDRFDEEYLTLFARRVR